VAFIIEAIVVPEDDCSMAMTRDCFEFGSAFLTFDAAGVGCVEFAGGTSAADDAAGRCFVDFDIEILRSVMAASRRTTEAPPWL
jgi:hypothetical protein